MHKAGQIVERVVVILGARVGPKGSKVYGHRRLSLSLEQDELSAHSVDYGEDRAAEQRFTQMLDSVLAVQTTAMVACPTEKEVREALLDMRRQQHIAIMADQRLGLPNFVVTTRYGGAEPPEIAVDGEFIVGALTSTWLIHYRMELNDPGND